MCFLAHKTLKINSLISAIFLMGCNIAESGAAIKDLGRTLSNARFLLITSILLNVCALAAIAVGIYGVIITNLKILRMFMVTLIVYFQCKLFITLVVDLLQQQQYILICSPFYTIDAIFSVIEMGFLGFYYSGLREIDNPALENKNH